MLRLLLSVLLAAASLPAQSASRSLARDIFKELIEINTTDSSGDCTKAAEAMAARFRAAGFPSEDVKVLGPHPKKGNLVARLRGAGGGQPILLIAHLDVVEARRSDWSFDPFTFLEKDGFFYGRGAQDMKGDAAVFVATLLRLRQEGWRPRRDLILALTADEEGGGYNGVHWLLERHRGLMGAAFCINADSGGGQIRKGRQVAMTLGAAEKVYLDFRLEVTNPGGHSSLPTKENAIYRLSEGLARLAKFDFPPRLNQVTRMFFERSASLAPGQEANDMKAILQSPPDAAALARLSQSAYFNAMLRTTCVATMLEAGHARNALPQRAAANVNCRMLPDEPAERARDILAGVLADPKITVTPAGPPRPSPPSPLTREILDPVERLTRKLWGDVPVVPVMDTGATDGLYLRRAGVPVYGVSGVFSDVDDIRAHGRDERIPVRSFYDALDFMYELIKSLSAAD
jgi:acetylornithine deacetylase/succinyl-diaminopimelate desuccinylase-like protein